MNDNEPKFYTYSDLLIAEGCNRIVVTDRGDEYYEFNDEHLNKDNIHVPEDANWRFRRPFVYYYEYRSNCEEFIKIYHQKRSVTYADYMIGKWYIAVEDLYKVE